MTTGQDRAGGVVARFRPCHAPLPVRAWRLCAGTLTALLLGCAAPAPVPEPLPSAAPPPGQGTGPLAKMGIDLPRFRKSGRRYPSLAPLLKEITPAVVNVSVLSAVDFSGYPFLNDPNFRRFLEKFNLEPPDPGQTQSRQSIGSGVIIDGPRGLVLTNAHVTEDADQITVTLKDRRSFRARLLGRDPSTDIALLRIPPVTAPRLRFANSDQLEVGDFVLAIGNPFGLGQTVTLGIVSAVGRDSIAGNTLGDLIQTDASINPGNSGGPLIDLAGEVVGINSALIGPTGSSVGIGFAVPSNRVQMAMQRILGRGTLRAD